MGKQKFSRGLKRSICIEYMQSGKSRKEIALKYNLPSVNTLASWINSCLSPLEIHEKCASLQPVTVQMDSDMAKEKEEEPMNVASRVFFIGLAAPGSSQPIQYEVNKRSMRSKQYPSVVYVLRKRVNLIQEKTNSLYYFYYSLILDIFISIIHAI